MPGFPYSAGAEPINTSPTVCDLLDDGHNEILFTRGNHVIALRGNGTVLWSNAVSAASYVPNGGYQTVTNGFYWYPTGAWMDRLPPTAVFSSEVSPPFVVQLNANGKREVVTAWKIRPDPSGDGQDYNPFIGAIYGVGPWGAMGESWSGGVVTFDAATGRQNFVYHLHHLVESGLAAGVPASGGPLALYVLNDSDSVVAFDKTQPFGLWGKGMLHKQFGKNQRLMTGSYLFPIDIYTADINGDGLDEVLVAGTQGSSLWQPNETILDDDGAILWRRWLPHVTVTNQFGWLNSASLIPVNPDHDNHIDVLGWNHSYELSFRFWNGVALVDRPGWPKNFYPFLPTLPVVGDVDGDGEEEIVIGTYNPTVPSSGELRIYALDGTLKQTVPVPGGIKHSPALGDVEGRGRTDVVYRSTAGQVYVQNFGATGTNLISWATHRGNAGRNGNCGISLFPPGTPLINQKTSGYKRAIFSWTNSASALGYRIFRAERAEGPFMQIATVMPSTISYQDDELRPGWQYFYEVGAIYASNMVRSAPFAILSSLNGNLIGNSGFERDDNCRWDKWFTGTIEATNMVITTNNPFQGLQAMEIVLRNQGNNSTIAQYNQYGIPDSTMYVTPGGFYSFGAWMRSGGLSQPSEHWLEWSSTKNGYDTNARPALPYPFYFTPHLILGTNATEWTYANRTFQLPAGFPNIELRHRYIIAAPGSGSFYLDNVFFRRIPDFQNAMWTNLIPFGASWRYNSTAPASNWTATNFNDRAWPVGWAKFGAGSGPVNVVTLLPQLRPNYSFRRQFVAPPEPLEELLLTATCADVADPTIPPVRVFLNGAEVPSFIDVASLQGNDVRYFDLTPFASMVHPGTNTIAVQLGNTWSDFDDVAFDLNLRGIAYQPSTVHLSIQAMSEGSQLIVKAPLNTIWQIESCDSLSAANWQFMQVFTNLTGQLVLPDTGQNGRLSPAQSGCRTYRLRPF